MKNELSLVFHAFARLFFPPLCVVCRRSLVRGEQYLCSACLADFPFTDRSYQSEEALSKEFEEPFRPEAIHSLFYYSKYNDYKNLIYALKYCSGKEVGVYLGRMLGERIRGATAADGIVPVPLHPRRQRQRGYNQAYQIAWGISEVLEIPVWDRVVRRVRNNASQTGKNAGERRKNVENIFELKDAALVRGKHILVVDDVITTGATLRACVQVLAGAGEVRFSLGCLARTEL